MPEFAMAVQLRFKDIDAYGHVNNGAYVSYLETARVVLSHEPVELASGSTTLGELLGHDRRTVVVDQYLEYRASLRFRVEPVEVAVRVTRIGTSSFDYGYEVREPDESTSYAIGHTGMTVTSRETGRPAPLDDAQREALGRFRGEPLSFRRLGVLTG